MPLEKNSTFITAPVAPRQRATVRPPAWSDSLMRRVGDSVEDAWRVSGLLHHPIRHLRLGLLLSRPAMNEFCASKTRLRLKYLVDYASKNLTTRQRYNVLTAHYTFLQRRFQPGFLRCVSTGKLAAWQAAGDDDALRIYLDFPETMQTEGDLCLTLRDGKHDVYRLIFAIARGATFDVQQAHVLLVTCVQGLRPSADLRAVSARCNDVHPSDLLMAALAGVGAATGIDTVIGITTANQIANKGRIFFSYDDFFIQYGQHREAIDAFQIALPYVQKPLTEMAAKHRSRTRAKRSLRQDVADAVDRTLAQYL